MIYLKIYKINVKKSVLFKLEMEYIYSKEKLLNQNNFDSLQLLIEDQITALFQSKYQYLSGTISITYMTNGKKKVYLLGDIHNRVGECSEDLPKISVEDWLYDMIKFNPQTSETNATIDLFLELGRDNSDITPESRKDVGAIFDTIIKFAPCIPSQNTYFEYPKVGDVENCPFSDDKLRVHLSDFRVSNIETLDIMNKKINITPNNYLKIFKSISSDEDSIYQKELSRLPKNISDNILKYIEQYIIRDKYKQSMIDDPHLCNLMLVSKFMDLYVLARLFKSYMNNIIIYAGLAHTDVYKYVLSKMGFKIKYEILGITGSKCLNIRDLKYPIFHNSGYGDTDIPLKLQF
jgi:hypothetical protein